MGKEFKHLKTQTKKKKKSIFELKTIDFTHT